MNKLNATAFALAALVFAAADADAQARIQTDNTYGMAGCGLGSMLFGNDPGFIQVIAATTNAFAGQTFAITTGTSNCTDGSTPVVQVSSFVETNRSVLVKDSARGSGETVRILAELAGCPDARAVGVTLQERFGLIFTPGASDTEISARVVTQLRRDKTLGCAKLGG